MRFKPKILKRCPPAKGSCGTYAIHCLTGISIPSIEKECPKKGWWDDASIRRFLKKHGYKTIPITEDMVHSTKPYRYRENLNHQHILLISTHSSKEEGTWEIAHNNRVYHGTEIEFFNGYEMLINPLWTAYLVWHPKWESSETKKRGQCEKYWITHQGDGFVFHPMSGKWFNPETEQFGTHPSSSTVRRPDRSSGSVQPRRARPRGRK